MKKQRDAIRVLALEAQLFPQSAAAHQSLGDAYAAAGETKLAIDSYQRSLALNPKNEAARAALSKLRAQR